MRAISDGFGCRIDYWLLIGIVVLMIMEYDIYFIDIWGLPVWYVFSWPSIWDLERSEKQRKGINIC